MTFMFSSFCSHMSNLFQGFCYNNTYYINSYYNSYYINFRNLIHVIHITAKVCIALEIADSQQRIKYSIKL